MCLTGVAPMVLRDANDAPPHRRYETKVRGSIPSIEEGEQLLWFFDRAFAYRLVNRFQSLQDFEQQVARFAETSNGAQLNFSDEIGEFARALQERDRSVQLATIDKSYKSIRDKLIADVGRLVRTGIGNAGQLNAAQFAQSGLSNCRPNIPNATLLEDNVPGFYFTHPPFPHAATALYAAFAVDMQIHFYVTAFTAPATQVVHPESSSIWEKVATVPSIEKPNLPQLVELIGNRVQSMLAREVRRLRSKLG